MRGQDANSRLKLQLELEKAEKDLLLRTLEYDAAGLSGMSVETDGRLGEDRLQTKSSELVAANEALEQEKDRASKLSFMFDHIKNELASRIVRASLV